MQITTVAPILCSLFYTDIIIFINIKNSVAFSPQANYTDRVPPRSAKFMRTFAGRGGCVVITMITTAVNIGFRHRLLFLLQLLLLFMLFLTIFWKMASFNLIEVRYRFGGICHFHLHCNICAKQLQAKSDYYYVIISCCHENVISNH
jgi:hypothetical protein